MSDNGAVAMAVEEVLSEGGKNAQKLAILFFEQMDNEHSRTRGYLKKLLSRPKEWILSAFFAPLILGWCLFKLVGNVSLTKNPIQFIQVFVVLGGFGVASLATWLAGTYFGTFGFF